MNLFTIFDLVFLIGFCLFLIIFLYSRRKKLKREGLLYLYRTKWGIKLINYVGRKYKKTLHVLSYISVGLGYVLMAGMLYLLGKIVYIYISSPQLVRAIKVPPIMPLIPYLPQMFNLDFLPPFYFTYWIVIIAIIAITHEFAHGIFARYFDVKVKATGFGFLGPFLAAFVEPDEEQMKKKNKFSQLAILSAGTFANVLTAILFLVILFAFFSFAFSPAGVVFDTYSYSAVDISDINSVNGIVIENPNYEKILELVNGEKFDEIKTADEKYFVNREILEQQKEYEDFLILYDDAPAINAGLVGAIIEINSIEVKSMEDLKNELEKYSPEEKINLKTKTSNETLEYEIVLGEHPKKENVAWLGIGFSVQEREGLISKMYSVLSSFKQEHVYYEPKCESMIFIYDLLWWIILISISVALINMLPVGIFDGGRVFYLTVLAAVKNENRAKKIFSWMSGLILLILLILILFWFFAFR